MLTRRKAHRPSLDRRRRLDRIRNHYRTVRRAGAGGVHWPRALKYRTAWSARNLRRQVTEIRNSLAWGSLLINWSGIHICACPTRFSFARVKPTTPAGVLQPREPWFDCASLSAIIGAPSVRVHLPDYEHQKIRRDFERGWPAGTQFEQTRIAGLPVSRVPSPLS